MSKSENQVFDFEKICRLCLGEKRSMSAIFTKKKSDKKVPLPVRIMSCASLELFEGDGMPTSICNKCLVTVNASYAFREQCEQADTTLRRYAAQQQEKEGKVEELDEQPQEQEYEEEDDEEQEDMQQEEAEQGDSEDQTEPSPSTEDANTTNHNDGGLMEIKTEPGLPEEEFEEVLEHDPLVAVQIDIGRVEVPGSQLGDIKQESVDDMGKCSNSRVELKVEFPIKEETPAYYVAPPTSPLIPLPLECVIDDISSTATKSELFSVTDQYKKNNRGGAKLSKTHNNKKLVRNPMRTNKSSKSSERLQSDPATPLNFGTDVTFTKTGRKLKKTAIQTTQDGDQVLEKGKTVVRKKKATDATVCENSEDGDQVMPETTKHEKSKKKNVDSTRAMPSHKSRPSKLLAYEDKFSTVGDGKVVCLICNSVLRRMGFIAHYNFVHAKAIMGVCDVCGAEFTRKDKLKRHLMQHNPEKPFACDICQFSFHFSYQLKRHMRNHSGVRPHVCSCCGKAFKTNSHLRFHEEHKHKIKNRVFTCASCGQGFNVWGHHQRHLAECKGVPLDVRRRKQKNLTSEELGQIPPNTM